MWHLTVPVKSHKVQLEAMHSSKQSAFERDFEGQKNMVESAFEEKEACSNVLSKEKTVCSEVLPKENKNMLEQRFRALSGFQARSSSDFECSVASKEKEACSSSDFERSVAFRRYKKQARAVISSAQRPKSTLEQCVRVSRWRRSTFEQ